MRIPKGNETDAETNTTWKCANYAARHIRRYILYNIQEIDVVDWYRSSHLTAWQICLPRARRQAVEINPKEVISVTNAVGTWFYRCL